MRNVLFSSPLFSSLFLFRYFASNQALWLLPPIISLYLSSAFLVYQKHQMHIFLFSVPYLIIYRIKKKIPAPFWRALTKNVITIKNLSACILLSTFNLYYSIIKTIMMSRFLLFTLVSSVVIVHSLSSSSLFSSSSSVSMSALSASDGNIQFLNKVSLFKNGLSRCTLLSHNILSYW